VSAVIAGCAADNTPSIRLLKRIGFQRTGTEGEQLRWRLEAVAPDPR
jgi:RimJ/RimL family protein N-acetyltransferase